MVILGAQRHGASFIPKFLRGSYLKWWGPSGPPLWTDGSEN